MKISHNWLQQYFAKPLPSPEKLDELFTFHAFEVEGMERIGIDGSVINGKSADGKPHEVVDTVYDLKVLPDRAHYALCHKGIAGEVFSMTETPRMEMKNVEISGDLIEKPSITIGAEGFCRRYVGRYVEIHSKGETPIIVSTALHAIGQRTISSIVDATNYVMFDIGQPLHAFDADKVQGSIVVRAAKKGEKIALLESSEGLAREIELSDSDHVIADDIGPLAIAGVKGGKRAAITGETKRLILESANFDPTIVRRTSTKYDLRSESSKRYENEITPELALGGMNELSETILEAIPDAKFGPIVDVYPTKAVRTTIEMDPNYINERLGVEVPIETAKKILEGMGIVVESAESKVSKVHQVHQVSKVLKVDNKSMWKLTIPFNRLDLTIPDDIVEEVGRIYGYEHIVGILPPKPEGTIRVLSIYYIAEKIKNILTGQGYSEVSLYSLVAKGEIETAKPLARDKAFARSTLVDGMMTCVEKNILNADLLGLDSVKVFEIGHVFSNAGESVRLSIGAAQVRKVKGVNGKKLIDSAIEILGKELGTRSDQSNIDQLSIDIRHSPAGGADDKETINQSDNKTIKQLNGQSQIIEKGPIAIIEIDLNELLKSYKLPADASYDDLGFGPASTNIYQKISSYPFIVRDVAVFVPESVTAGEVWKTIEDGIAAVKVLAVGNVSPSDLDSSAGAIRLLARHTLFDTFKKDGRVSYAYRMVFQSMERTLTDDEANNIMTAIYEALKGNGWEVR